jgi:uncharacterized coiled-coil protein SlyX
MNTELRLTNLELDYMKLERLTAELSKVVAEQQKTLDRLVAQVTSHGARLHDLPDPTTDDKPPHY